MNQDRSSGASAPTTSRRSVAAAPLVMAALLVAGVADLALGLRRVESFVLGALLSALLLPWGLMLLGGATNRAVAAGRSVDTPFSRRRSLVVRGVVLLLVGALVAAKWGVYLAALESGGAELVGPYRSYGVAIVVLALLALVLRGDRTAGFVAASASHPARLMAVTFGIASVVGALLLSLPISVRRVADVSMLDAFFVSTSAVCVTGLSTVNVADTYTIVGQVVLCLIMQVGGLGIMVLAAAVTILAGRRLGVKSSSVLAEMVDERSLSNLRRTIRTIVLYTLAFEAVGAALLYVQFAGVAGIDRTGSSEGDLAGAGGALWAAIFHSVSAFTNASFSNFRGGLVPFARAPGVCQTISALIVVGGLGFPVMAELLTRWVERSRGVRPRRLTLNARLCLVTTALLLGVVAIAYFALERGKSFAHLGVLDQLNAAIFQSACSRTSGFNVVDVASMRPATLLLTCLAMFIGGDPGSCAGGIKTTTVAVLFAAYRGELGGRRPRLFDRTVPEPVVRRAMGVAFLSTSLIVGVVFVLLLTEKHDPLALLFETASAFSTTGLTTGITPTLSVAGKLLLCLTMLIGRVGPLTMALALSSRERAPAYDLPEERVMIG